MIPEYLYKGVLLVNDEISLYEELPLEFLAGFFYQYIETIMVFYPMPCTMR